MEQSGIFINYQMVEAIELFERFNLNTLEGKKSAEEALVNLKKEWLNHTFPGTNIKIGNRITGMQDITFDDVVQLSVLAKQVDTYTAQNTGALQNIFVADGADKWHFDFEKLDKIARFAAKNQKKLVIDSAVVFGDYFPTKLERYDSQTIKKIIEDYTGSLINRYGNLIDRMDVLNAIYQRDALEASYITNPDIVNNIDNKEQKNHEVQRLTNNTPINTTILEEKKDYHHNDRSKILGTEEFWIQKFGANYGQNIISIVREIVNSNNSNIKLGWNEFYLTNSRFAQRKQDFISVIKSIKDLDVVGVQDRFLSGESLEYTGRSLDEITSACKTTNKTVCLTEFSCSPSSFDLRNCSAHEINGKSQNVRSFLKDYARKNDTIERIEGPAGDKFDYNYKKLTDSGYDISTTGKKSVIEEQRKPSFDTRSQTEIDVYQQIKTKNQAIKKQKQQLIQQNQFDKPKVKTLTLPNNQPSNHTGFINSFILFLIIGLICVGLLMLTYIVIGGNLK